MPTVSLEATELEDVNVQYVSLVKRGANRIPFRIIKQEKDPMIDLDLSRIFKRAKAQEVRIHTLVIAKEDFSDEVSSALTEAGFSVDRVEDREDGFLLVHQVEKSDKTLVAVKLNDHVVALVPSDIRPSHVAKADEPEAVTAFHSALRADGFEPGIELAAPYLEKAISEVLAVAKTSAEASESIRALTDAYGSYVAGLAADFDPSLFAVADAIQKMAKAKKPHKEMESPEEDATDMTEKDCAPGGKKAKKDEDEDSNTESTVEKDEGKEKGKEESASASTQEDPLEKVSKQLSDLASTISSLKDQMEGMGQALKAEVDALKVDVQSVSDLATTVQQTVKGTVIGAPPKGDPAHSRTVEKKESLGCVDTAFQPSIRKTARRY